MDEERCPNCHKHCHKDHLHCDRGRAYFNVTPTEGASSASTPSSDFAQMLGKLESSYKASERKATYFKCLTVCEKTILSALIDKLIKENEKK